MTLLTWNHTCSVGVKAMDDQHGILMDTINELRLALVHGGGRDQVSGFLKQLIDFPRQHFASEEQLMEQSGFPGVAAHRAEHQRMMEVLRASAQRAQHGEEVQMRMLLCGLRDGFLDHIGGPDQEYGPWLNEHGIR